MIRKIRLSIVVAYYNIYVEVIFETKMVHYRHHVIDFNCRYIGNRGRNRLNLKPSRVRLVFLDFLPKLRSNLWGVIRPIKTCLISKWSIIIVVLSASVVYVLWVTVVALVQHRNTTSPVKDFGFWTKPLDCFWGCDGRLGCRRASSHFHSPTDTNRVRVVPNNNNNNNII